MNENPEFEEILLNLFKNEEHYIQREMLSSLERKGEKDTSLYKRMKRIHDGEENFIESDGYSKKQRESIKLYNHYYKLWKEDKDDFLEYYENLSLEDKFSVMNAISITPVEIDEELFDIVTNAYYRSLEEKQRQDDPTYIKELITTREFNLSKLKLSITAKKIDTNSRYAITHKFREIQLDNSGKPASSLSVKDYFEKIEELINEYSSTTFDTDSLLKSVTKMCQHYVNTYKKINEYIIDVNLDLALVLAEAIKKSEGEELRKDEGEKLRYHLKTHLMNTFLK